MIPIANHHFWWGRCEIAPKTCRQQACVRPCKARFWRSSFNLRWVKTQQRSERLLKNTQQIMVFTVFNHFMRHDMAWQPYSSVSNCVSNSRGNFSPKRPHPVLQGDPGAGAPYGEETGRHLKANPTAASHR